MPNAENRPAHPQAQLPEPVTFPAVVQDEQHTIKTRKDEKGTLFVQVERKNGQEETVLFSAAITPENRVRLVFDAAPLTPEPVAVQPPTLAPASESAATNIETLPVGGNEQKEKEKPVRLRGRIATDIRRLPSPTGGTMARFQFAEHPKQVQWSYWNTEQEDERPPLKNNTVYRSIGAFDDAVVLLEGVEKGREYDITCFKRSWQEKADNGKQKTVKGFYLLDLQKVTKRAASAQEQQLPL